MKASIPTQLTERHVPRFNLLDELEIERVQTRVLEQIGRPRARVAKAAADLVNFLQVHEFDMCRTILALARENDPVGRSALEKLCGRPIVPWSSSVEERIASGEVAADRRGKSSSNAARNPRTAPVDDRVVVWVKPNPRKPGTDAHEAYKGWVVGKTVSECMTAGVDARALRRDVRDENVKLEGGA